jgi:hypothetical protein
MLPPPVSRASPASPSTCCWTVPGRRLAQCPAGAAPGPAAYAALARQGAARDLRDAVAGFTERYVLRGRCPADDVLDRATARP